MCLLDYLQRTKEINWILVLPWGPNVVTYRSDTICNLPQISLKLKKKRLGENTINCRIFRDKPNTLYKFVSLFMCLLLHPWIHTIVVSLVYVWSSLLSIAFKFLTMVIVTRFDYKTRLGFHRNHTNITQHYSIILFRLHNL